MADVLLTLDALRYEAGDRALIRDVSLRIEAGRRTLILGPNGAGKSVLMRLMHGLIEPTAGRILWNGGSGTPVQAMVFQRPVMLRRSVLDNVTYALYLAGVPAAERRARALDVLERVGLAALADRPARVLSGGEQQRVALARAWALRPRVLFLDEPTASLDPDAAAEVERIIRVIADDG
ncbi:MAG: ABC transporter ATP-binding protein, partial [Methyloversatilis sp.]|nr:ABC transporter ATP-binding protein [Methyloversatilis sp.]